MVRWEVGTGECLESLGPARLCILANNNNQKPVPSKTESTSIWGRLQTSISACLQTYAHTQLTDMLYMCSRSSPRWVDMLTVWPPFTSLSLTLRQSLKMATGRAAAYYCCWHGFRNTSIPKHLARHLRVCLLLKFVLQSYILLGDFQALQSISHNNSLAWHMLPQDPFHRTPEGMNTGLGVITFLLRLECDGNKTKGVGPSCPSVCKLHFSIWYRLESSQSPQGGTPLTSLWEETFNAQ